MPISGARSGVRKDSVLPLAIVTSNGLLYKTIFSNIYHSEE
jgi:hypothetical protein